MQTFLLAFVVSVVAALLILRYNHLHGHLTADHDLDGVQKFHPHPVPRVGGVAVMVGILAVGGLVSVLRPEISRQFWLLLMASIPAFMGGLVEDLTKRVGVLTRLGLTMLAAAGGFWLLNAGISRVDIPIIDTALRLWPVALVFTVFAVAGVANAINIIDGYNGLAGVVTVNIFMALGYVSYQVGDAMLWTICLAAAGAILGFLVWNYPRGLIFLGDGGAYLIGFLIGEISVLLVVRHPEVSAWFPFLLVFYPIFETLFSIYRRVLLRNGSPGMPDAVHMHQMIYKRLVRWAVGSRQANDKVWRNAMTSPYLWVLSSLTVIPAVAFWNRPHWLLLFTLLFVASYTWLYRRLVRFRSPRWLMIRYHHDSNRSSSHRIHKKED
ncbi:MraY family glycosyltransferase [Parachitinimonas caeni]|uniref:Glycosyltransferase n=1 Tax=Parachitinimonas caeni TaxID=3031301 RepID=A0ABT7DS52_9NEIS|nr:glycosyltransferase [Parachitinimonas caeni]MDK2122900.1 glycosyltransferase [Parachitinimonas caeni]